MKLTTEELDTLAGYACEAQMDEGDRWLWMSDNSKRLLDLGLIRQIPTPPAWRVPLGYTARAEITDEGLAMAALLGLAP